MPFDGSGTYAPPSAPTFPAVAGAVISAAYYNAVINDVATALTNTLTRDGQGKPSANIDFNNKNLSNVAALSAVSLTTTGALAGATLATTGNATVGGTLGVTGTVTLTAGLTVGTTLGVTGNATVGGTLGVTGVATVASAVITGNATVGGTLGVTGVMTAGTAAITTLTLTNALGLGSGGTAATTAAGARTSLGAAALGAITASGVTMATARLLGRTTASVGAPEEITVGTGLTLVAGVLAATAGAVPNAATFNNSGAGVASGTTFDGSVARTISSNTIGAQPETPREQAVASAATVTPTFANDIVIITAQAVALALANPTGTVIPNFGMVIRVKDNGVARAVTYGTQYRAIGVTLPTTTVINKTLYLGMVYNVADTKWDVTAVCQEV